MILECIVTTMDVAGQVNVAPMGITPRDRDVVILRPFRDTATCRNLVATGQAVANLTDDAALYVYAALGDASPPTIPATRVEGAILADACSAWELAVINMDLSAERATATCRVVARHRFRDFIGYNRARAALLEAAIVATRLHLLDPADVRHELDRLQVVVRKTGDDRELAAMDFILQYVGRTRHAEPTGTGPGGGNPGPAAPGLL